MASNIIQPSINEVDYPGLERKDYDEGAQYIGTRDAFEQSRLLPPGTPFPGEVPGKRGSRWRDTDGRRFVLSKYRKSPPTFWLSIYLTDRERKAHRHSLQVKSDLEKLDKEIATFDVSEKYFRQVRDHVAQAAYFSATQSRGELWRYSPSVLAALDYHFREIFTLLDDGAVMRQPEKLETLHKRRAALADTKFRKAMLAIVK